MDGKTFDSLLKLTANSTGRRRLVQAAAAAGIGGFLSRGGATAQVVAEACQNRQTQMQSDPGVRVPQRRGIQKRRLQTAVKEM